jgi:hypothetical protein
MSRDLCTQNLPHPLTAAFGTKEAFAAMPKSSPVVGVLLTASTRSSPFSP